MDTIMWPLCWNPGLLIIDSAILPIGHHNPQQKTVTISKSNIGTYILSLFMHNSC